MARLYDRADIYDLLETEERYQITKRHWETVLPGRSIGTLLDVSIGSGNLTLPLAELGVRLYGSDLSGEMLKRCEEKARKKGFAVDLRLSDFRRLDEHFDTAFDCVASTGNSLPYVTNGEVLDVLGQMDRLVKPGGYLYVDIRNWDKILETKQRFYLYNPTFLDDVRMNLVQVWDHHGDGSMTFNLLYTFERGNKIIQKEIFEERYFPLKRRLLLDGLKRLGYGEMELVCLPAFLETVKPEDADWYCVLARKQEALA